MTTADERLARLEGAYEHFATKADIGDVRAEIGEVRAEIANLKADLLKWMVGMMISSVALAVTVAIFIERLID